MKTLTKIGLPLRILREAMVPVGLSGLLLAPAVGAQDWVQASATGPSARVGHALAFDPLLGESVLFGGYSGTHHADTWSWSGQRWLQFAPAAAPPPRAHHRMALDPGRGRIVLFGGTRSATGPNYLGDTWEWDGTNWQAMTPANSPSPRSLPAMAFDPNRSRVLLFGGQDAQGWLDDTWEWDGSTWTQLQPASRPPSRYAHAMTTDFSQRAVTLFGGHNGSFLGDTWEWRGSNWFQVFPMQSPAERSSHTMVAAPALGRTFLFGGRAISSTPFADAWVWQSGQWQQLTSTTAPSGRFQHGMDFDPVRCRVVLFGGEIGPPSAWVGDTWEFQPSGTYSPFGAACPGTRGLPRLSSSAPPRIGLPFQVDLTNLPPNSVGAFFFGLSRSFWFPITLPVGLSEIGMPGCQLLVSGEILYVVASDPLGVSTWQPQTGGIPADPTLLGFGFFNQAFLIDLGANAGNLIATNGGAGVIGR